MGNREHRRANKIARERDVRVFYREYLSFLWHRGGGETRYEKLEEPVFWGYRRYFDLKKSTACSNKAHKWRAILDVVQSVEESRRKDFKVRLRRSKSWIDRPHKLRTLGRREFEHKIPSRWHRYFSFRLRRGKRRYYFLHPHLFESKREKVYITHRLLLDRAYERRRGYVDNVIHNRRYEQAWNHMNQSRPRSRLPWYCYEERTKQRFQQRMLEEEISEGRNEWYFGEALTDTMIRETWQTNHHV